MRTISRDKVELYSPSRHRQPFPDELGVMVAGIVQKHMDQPHRRIEGLNRRQKRNCAHGVYRQHLFNARLAGFKD